MKLSQKVVKSAIEKSNLGSVIEVAEICKVKRQTIYSFCNKPENLFLKDLMKEKHDNYVNEDVVIANTVIRQKLEEGCVKTAIWVMEAMGGVVKTNKTDVSGSVKVETIELVEVRRNET